jgi:multiple sugar transport system permease protein
MHGTGLRDSLWAVIAAGLYPFMRLSSPRNKTVAITLATFFDNEDTPWNDPVAASLIYALPPIALFFAVRRYIAAGLTRGGVKG